MENKLVSNKYFLEEKCFKCVNGYIIHYNNDIKTLQNR